MSFHIDHIEPRWEEGRDYQLVCGLDVVYNMCERDSALNISKSNRFVPWRWSRDELGDVPVEPGDLCLFLKHGTNEWILEEFLGTWWYDQSKLWGYAKTQPLSEETKRALAGRTPTAEERKKAREGSKKRWMCLKTGVVMVRASLSKFQNAIGIDTIYQAPVETNPTPEIDLIQLVRNVKEGTRRPNDLTDLAKDLGLPRRVIYLVSRRWARL